MTRRSSAISNRNDGRYTHTPKLVKFVITRISSRMHLSHARFCVTVVNLGSAATRGERRRCVHAADKLISALDREPAA